MNTNTNVSDCLELMRKLVEYRQQKALHHQLMKAADCSMLGIDAIVMLYHCAKVSVGDVLEVGAYIGGATIAMAMGVRDSGMQKKVISIERGCRVDLPRGGTVAQRHRQQDVVQHRVPFQQCRRLEHEAQPATPQRGA